MHNIYPCFSDCHNDNYVRYYEQYQHRAAKKETENGAGQDRWVVD